jgi:hypothetical protein
MVMTPQQDRYLRPALSPTPPPAAPLCASVEISASGDAPNAPLREVRDEIDVAL